MELTWKDIKNIVNIADCLANLAAENAWTEQEYYEHILEEWNDGKR